MSQENKIEAKKLSSTTDFPPSDGASCSACGFDPKWGKRYSGPHVTSDTEWKREWVHAQPLRFYLYKVENGKNEGKWCVIDRYYDLADGGFLARKGDCVKSFIKRHSEPNAKMSHAGTDTPERSEPQAGSALAPSSCSAPLVLDVCCGPRMMWFDKKDPRAIYHDKRNEEYRIEPNAAYPNGTTLKVVPDVQGDFSNLQFPDESFRLVVFDPPHYTKIGTTGVLGKTYWKLFPDWEDEMELGFSECFRVLKDEGILIFKWCSTEIPLDRVMKLAEPQKPLFGHNTGHRAQTHWMTFLKQNNII